MKKNKNSVPLISALVVIVAVSFLFNQKVKTTYGTPEELQQQEMERMQAQAREEAAKRPQGTAPKQEPSAVSAGLKSALSKATTPNEAKAVEEGPSGPGGPSEKKGEKILVPKEPAMAKPKPNDSAVSGQWW